MFGLHAIRDKLTATTTLYERNLIMMASVVAAGPRLVLLDEPAGGLTEGEIKSLIQHTRKLTGLARAILIIEHVMPVIMELSTRVVVLDRGQIFAEGHPAEIRQDQRVRRLYFGEVA
jgi:branched-chain amino acid transport system ATP-binding protein